MEFGALVLIPPLLVFLFALTTKNVPLSLLIGIGSSAFIASGFAIWKSLILITSRLITQTGIPDLVFRTGNYDQIVMFAFLILVGVLIELLTHTGGLRVYSGAIARRVHSARSAQIATLLLSLCFFLDDYFNALMVGSIMRPITDKFKIARAKLAYLLNATTSPLAVLVPASSWVGMILTQFEAGGITMVPHFKTIMVIDPFHLYLMVIPFLFYPILSIITAWIIVTKNISFGLMHSFEKTASETGNLYGGKEPLRQHTEHFTKHGSLTDVLLPLIIFVTTTISVILYTGKYWLLGGHNTFIYAFMSGNNVMALFFATLLATMVSATLSFAKKQLNLKQFISVARKGYMIMHSSILILWLAWTLSSFLEGDLHTGDYLAPLLLKTVNISLLPLLFFVIAVLSSVTTGSSWGTISFLVPLALPLMGHLLGHIPLDVAYAYSLASIAAAIISGAIAGCQLSPITDATVMASTSAGCYHMDHAKTMASYSLAPLVGATVAFFASNMLFTYSVYFATIGSLVLGLLACISYIYIRQYHYKRMRQNIMPEGSGINY